MKKEMFSWSTEGEKEKAAQQSSLSLKTELSHKGEVAVTQVKEHFRQFTDQTKLRLTWWYGYKVY